MPNRKYRRCQECATVRRAGEFKRAPKSDLIGPERRVVCPAWAFVTVEKLAEQEGQD